MAKGTRVTVYVPNVRRTYCMRGIFGRAKDKDSPKVVKSMDELTFQFNGRVKCPGCRYRTYHEFSNEAISVKGKRYRIYVCLVCGYMSRRKV